MNIRRNPRAALLLVVLMCFSVFTGCQTPPFYRAPSVKDQVPLDPAIRNVERTIRYYQTHLREVMDTSLPAGRRPFPPLKEVEFDFRTATGAKAGGGVSMYLVTLGASAERDKMHEITYTYKELPHAEYKSASEGVPPLYSELVETIQTVAAAVEGAHILGEGYDTMKVQVQFGFSYNVSIAGGFPFDIVTVGANAGYNKNSVQTVTLTFKPPP